MKKKILILVDWFAPGYKAGGPIQSCINIAFLLKKNFEIYVLTTDTDLGEDKPYPGIVSNQWINNLDPDINVYYAGAKTLSVQQIRIEMERIAPDFVYLNHLFSPKFVLYPLWLKYRRMISAKVVLCPRGALYQSALAIKSYKKKPFIKTFRLLGIHRLIRFHATNEREKNVILKFFPNSEVYIADNLPNAKQPAFESCVKIPGLLRCIYVSRILPIKNLLYLIEVLRKLKAEVALTVIGPLEDKEYSKRCEEAAKTLPSNISVHWLGPKPNHELIRFIQQHHLFVLPTEGENFGHSIFESFLAGRPVLISDQTPWLSLEEKKAGWDLSLANPNGFANALEKMASFNQQEFDTWAKASWDYANAFIQKPDLYSKYLQLFS